MARIAFYQLDCAERAVDYVVEEFKAKIEKILEKRKKEAPVEKLSSASYVLEVGYRRIFNVLLDQGEVSDGDYELFAEEMDESICDFSEEVNERLGEWIQSQTFKEHGTSLDIEILECWNVLNNRDDVRVEVSIFRY